LSLADRDCAGRRSYRPKRSSQALSAKGMSVRMAKKIAGFSFDMMSSVSGFFLGLKQTLPIAGSNTSSAANGG
jgi:hypothetical protein